MNNFYNQLALLLVGDRVLVPKSAFNLIQHHAIYVGFENGTHYLVENKDFVGVRLVTADLFFKEVPHITRIERFVPSINYSRYDLKCFALAKLKTPYHLTDYNCEHFANEVQHGHRKSLQVDNLTGFAKLAASVFFIAGILRSFD